MSVNIKRLFFVPCIPTGAHRLWSSAGGRHIGGMSVGIDRRRTVRGNFKDKLSGGVVWSSVGIPILRRAHNTYGDRCFATAGPRVWNSLPAELQQCSSLRL